MKNYLKFAVALSLILAGVGAFATFRASADAPPQAIADQIIAREKASVDAWKRKDKAYWMDLFTDDSTFFSPVNPYLESDPKVNFFPKIEQYFELYKYNDFQMYNPRVQVYGDTAILTYNSSVSLTLAGTPMNYTGKVTSVYIKQGSTWRVAHGHETMNPDGK